MKHFFIRIEIEDGEHGYYHRSVCDARNETSAKNKAEREAKWWYDDKPEVTKEANGSKSYYFPYVQVGTSVDEVREIPKDHYEILKQYL